MNYVGVTEEDCMSSVLSEIFLLYVGLSLQFGANASPATFQHMSSHIVRIGMRLGRLSSLAYIDDLFGTLTMAEK